MKVKTGQYEQRTDGDVVIADAPNPYKSPHTEATLDAPAAYTPSGQDGARGDE